MNDQPCPYVTIKKYDSHRNINRLYKGFIINQQGCDINFIAWYPKAARYKKIYVYYSEVIGSAGKIPRDGIDFIVEELNKRDRIQLEVGSIGKVFVKGIQIGVIGGIKNGT